LLNDSINVSNNVYYHDTKINCVDKIHINIIATDGNYSYNKIIKTEGVDRYCDRHIISKSETCLVESYNSSMRDTFARFRRKTKCYSKSLKMVYYSMLMWCNIWEFKNMIKNVIFV
jgi:IS1 family transposase